MIDIDSPLILGGGERVQKPRFRFFFPNHAWFLYPFKAKQCCKLNIPNVSCWACAGEKTEKDGEDDTTVNKHMVKGEDVFSTNFQK